MRHPSVVKRIISSNLACIFVLLLHLSHCVPLNEVSAAQNKYFDKSKIIEDYNFQEGASTEKPYEQNHHSITKKDGVLDDDQSATVLKIEAENHDTLENILVSILSSSSLEENGLGALHNVSDDTLEAVLTYIAENLMNSSEDEDKNTPKTQTNEESEELHQTAINVEPQLQFLEPDLGPAVLPLQVPYGYFVPFIPRKAFGVANGVARPPHGHASFYKHRPRGLVDVRNSPAYGYFLGGP